MKKNNPPAISKPKSKISKPQSLRALVVEDSKDDVLRIIRKLKKGGYDPVYERVETAVAMKKALQENQWDIILCDYKLSKFNAISVIALLKETNIDIPLIIVSGTIGEETAVECMRLGAQDYIMKDNLSRLCPAIARELEEADSRIKRKQAESQREAALEALRESEARYRLLADNMTDTTIWLTDMNLRITYNSPSVAKKRGYTDEEIKQIPLEKHLTPESFHKVMTAFSEEMVKLKADPSYLFERTLELEVYRKNGTTFWSEITFSLIRDKNGTPLSILSEGRDITKRKKAEEELRQNEEKYQGILENIQEGYFENNLAGNFTFVNDAMCKRSGYSKEELIGKNNRQYTDEETAKRIYQVYNKIYRTGEPSKGIEVEYIRKDGTKATYEMSTSLMRDAHGKPIGFRGISHDITERKQADEKLRQSEEKYRGIIENMQEGYFENDLAGNFTFVNDAMCKRSGYSKEEMIGKNNRQYTDEETAKKIYQVYNKIYRTGEPSKGFEVEYIRKDGTKATCELSPSFIRDAHGKPIGFRSISYDITARKQAEEALRKSEEKYRLVVENAREAIIITQDVKMLFVNRAAMDMIGYSEETLTSNPFTDFIHPDDRDMVVDYHIRRIKGEKVPSVYSFRVINQDGIVKWAGLKAAVIQWEGRPATLNFLSDITERKQMEEALRQSEERYRTILETMQEGYYELDLAGNFTFVNDAEAKNLGYSREESIGMNSRNYQSEEEVKKSYQIFSRIYKTGEPVKGYTFEITKKDGTKAFHEVSASLLRDAEDRPIGFRGVSRDVTERKQAEEALRKSEENFRLSLDNSPLGIRISTLEGKTLYANQAVLDIYGYDSIEELRGTPLKKRYTSESYAEFKIRKGKRKRGELDLSEYEINIVRKNGEIRHLQVFRKEVIWNGVKQFQVIYHDITEQKRIEKELKKSEEKYWLTFSSTSDIIFTVNSELKVSDITPSVEKILGYKPEELLNRSFKNLNLMTPESLEKAITNMMRVLSGEEVPITVYEFITKDGIRVIGEITGSPVIQENKIIGVTCVARDVTERKRTEEEREKLQAQLLQSQKMESVGRLAGGVAHDFNNFLTAVLCHTEVAMKRCNPAEPIHVNLKAIERSTRRSADLIHQLLAFARKQTVAPKVLDLNDTVANMLKIIKPLIGEDIDFAWIPGASVWPVKIDPHQIDQLLANFCVNARDAISGVGKISIETENAVFDDAYCTVHHGFAPGEYVMLAVSDDGCGMDKDVLDHIFEPFFTTKEVGRGTGLGLATVYGIVKQNEGVIKVYSEPGKGSTFKTYLPRFVGEAMEPTAKSTAETPKGLGETVLLVEDDAEIRDASQIMLEELGYKVLTANTPGEALRQAKAQTAEIELLITDVVMPEMNGRDLAKLLSEIRPGLKCLFASGYTANIIAHQGVLEEGVHFLPKPFSMTDLAIKVRKALEQE